jgi:hypothetical protein
MNQELADKIVNYFLLEDIEPLTDTQYAEILSAIASHNMVLFLQCSLSILQAISSMSQEARLLVLTEVDRALLGGEDEDANLV